MSLGGDHVDLMAVIQFRIGDDVPGRWRSDFWYDEVVIEFCEREGTTMFARRMPSKARLSFLVFLSFWWANPLWAQQEDDRLSSETVTIRSVREIHAFEGSPDGRPYEIEGIVAYFDAICLSFLSQ